MNTGEIKVKEAGRGDSVKPVRGTIHGHGHDPVHLGGVGCGV